MTCYLKISTYHLTILIYYLKFLTYYLNIWLIISSDWKGKFEIWLGSGSSVTAAVPVCGGLFTSYSTLLGSVWRNAVSTSGLLGLFSVIGWRTWQSVKNFGVKMLLLKTEDPVEVVPPPPGWLALKLYQARATGQRTQGSSMRIISHSWLGNVWGILTFPTCSHCDGRKINEFSWRVPIIP